MVHRETQGLALESLWKDGVAGTETALSWELDLRYHSLGVPTPLPQWNFSPKPPILVPSCLFRTVGLRWPGEYDYKTVNGEIASLRPPSNADTELNPPQYLCVCRKLTICNIGNKYNKVKQEYRSRKERIRENLK